jgi:hypothetical protein
MSEPKRFPLCQECSSSKVPPGPRSIPWSVAEKAYDIYARKYGRDQSLEKLAERGGFYPGELDELYPQWRDEVSELARLTARVAELEKEYVMEGHLDVLAPPDDGTMPLDAGERRKDRAERACLEIERLRGLLDEQNTQLAGQMKRAETAERERDKLRAETNNRP